MRAQTPWLFETPSVLSQEIDETEVEWMPDHFGQSGKLHLNNFETGADSTFIRKFSTYYKVSSSVVDAFKTGLWAVAIQRAIEAGIRDKNTLTSMIFNWANPGRNFAPINPATEAKLVEEWKAYRDFFVTNLLKKATSSSGSGNISVSKNCIQIRNCNACENRIIAANPAQLVTVPSALVLGKKSILLDKQALDAFQKLYNVARANGVPDPYLKISSGYRSYNTQAGLWKGRLLTKFKNQGCNEVNLPCIGHAIDRTSQKLQSLRVPHPKDAWLKQFLNELKQGGCASCSPDKAVSNLRRGTAPPGSSPHHTGRAIDVYVGRAPNANSSTSTRPEHVAWQRQQPSFQWLVCNAARFGFHPYNTEPWHWEYNPPT